MEDKVMEKQKTGGNAQQLKKGLLVALLLGVATAYLREATMVVVDLYYAVVHGWWRSLGDSWLVLVEIAAAVCAILFLKKNSKVSLGLLAAWAVLMVIRLQDCCRTCTP